MKEKIVLITGIFILAYGMYGYFTISRGQQYNYNGGLIKKVHAFSEVDTNSKYKNTWRKEDKDIENVIVNLSQNKIKPTTSDVITIPPPPRHSH